VYSGTLGFLGLDGGCDMSVVIRTIVLDAAKGRWSIGCGGAIVHRSDPDGEFDEMMLKAKAPLRASVATLFGARYLSPTVEIPVRGLQDHRRPTVYASATDADSNTSALATDRPRGATAASSSASSHDDDGCGVPTNGNDGSSSSVHREVYAQTPSPPAGVSSNGSGGDAVAGPLSSTAAVEAVRRERSEVLLAGLGVRGMSMGLERIQAVLHQLGDPQCAVGGVVHVTGTNGKGSVCSYIEAALRGANAGPVGMFFSPHLVRFTESIRVDGVDVSDADLAEDVEMTLAACADASTELTQFEVLTVAAFLHFRRCGVKTAVLEVGLGGRLDATNVVRFAPPPPPHTHTHTHILVSAQRTALRCADALLQQWMCETGC
jgi:hypothetical protein